MEEILMPKLGMAQSYCIIERWLKKPGDKVSKGDALVEVSTDKITYEVESRFDGFLLKITRQEKDEVPVQEVIAYIGQLEEESLINTGANHENEIIKKATDVAKDSGTTVKREALISPLAKKIIADNKLDINLITGKGPGGRIMKEDVLEFMAANSQASENNTTASKIENDAFAPEIARVIKLEGIRKLIAEKMLFSKQNIPHISQSVNVDVTELVNFRENLEKSAQMKITFSDILLKAVSLALKANPEMNSAVINGEHIIYSDINPGLVTSLDQGLIIPVIKNCDRLSLQEISAKRNELIRKARQGNIEMENISGGTFTITNLGMLNVRSCTAIIYPPQTAILSVGGIFPSLELTPDGKTAIRKIIDITVTEDHRVLDGVAGARFLSALKEILEEPEKLQTQNS